MSNWVSWLARLTPCMPNKKVVNSIWQASYMACREPGKHIISPIKIDNNVHPQNLHDFSYVWLSNLTSLLDFPNVK